MSALEHIPSLHPSPLMAALSALLALIIAAVVLNRDPTRSDNRAFFAMIVFSLLSNLNAAALFFGSNPGSFENAQFRLIYAFGGLTMYAMVLFAHAFPFNRRASPGLLYGLGLLSLAHFVTTLLFPDAPAVLWYSRTYFPLCTALALYYIWQNFRKLETRSARLGLALVQSIIMVRYFMLALIFGLYRTGEVPQQAMMVWNFIITPPVMSALLGYGLMRFQLLGFRFFLSRSLAYFIVSTGALLFYLGLLTWLHRYLRWILGINNTSIYFTPILIVLLLLAFHPLRVKAEQLLDRWLDRGYVRARDASDRYFNSTVSVLDLRDLHVAVRRTVQDILPQGKLALLMARPSPRLLTLDGIHNFMPEGPGGGGSEAGKEVIAPDGTSEGQILEFPQAAVILRYFDQTGEAFLQRTEHQHFPGNVPEELNSLRVDLVIPFHREGAVDGVMLLRAPDADGARVQLLIGLALHLGLQLENSLLYQKAIDANEALTRANRTLDDTRLFLESLFESVPAGILVVGSSGRIVRWNRGMERLTGISRERALAVTDLAELLPELSFDGAGAQAANKGLTSSPLQCRLKLEALEREAVVHVRLSMFRDQQGGIGGTVVILNDVTEQIAMQEALEASKRLAALGQFAAAMAHEIRTPMTSIQMNVQILAGKVEMPPEDYEYFDIILTEMDRLNRTVGEILDFARPMKLVTADLEMKDLVDETVRGMYFLLAERGVEVKVEVQDGLVVQADGERLKQVLINLFDNASNAIVEQGQRQVDDEPAIVRVRGSSTPGPEGLPGVSLEVIDSGCGISKEALAHIFDPFYTTRPKGTGLGLAIAKKIVQAHKGDLLAESEKGRGSTFRMWLPASG